MHLALVLVVAAGVLTFVPSLAVAQGLLQTMQVFETRCAQCHGSATAVTAEAVRAPSRAMLAQLTPERVVDALTSGSMQANAQGMSDAAKRSVAEYLTGRPLGSAASGAASTMKNQCVAKPVG
ncbi:MAG: cytochrome c, partial [Vicinamibacterales bacterium]